MLPSSTSQLLEATDPVAYIRNAIAQKHFSLYAQPVLALKGVHQFPMAELFVRMREEESAVIPPGEFFPVWEAFGMMPELDRWVVREALIHMRSRAVSKSLCVTFEVTEQSATASIKATRIFREAIRGLGARLLIGDFRCSQGSFDLLRIVGANFVKLDGGIVRKLSSSHAAKESVGNLVRMSASRVLGVIGPAVEDTHTLGLLRELGVDFAQGTGVCSPAALESL